MGPLWAAADLITPMAIRVAATLRIADHVAAGRADDAALAEATGTDPRTLHRLLRHLVAAGVLSVSEGRYGLTGLGTELTGPTRDLLDATGAIGRADLAFTGLLHSVRTGEPAYPQVYGAGWWAQLDADPELSRSFDAQMSSLPPAGDVLQGFDWAGVRTVADVGGGNGSLLAGVLAAHPQLRGTLVERPGPAAGAAAVLDAAGVADRCEVVAGSFFDPLPAGLDVYVLCRILHDWDDAGAAAILRRCAEAGGAVLVVEESRIDSPDESELSSDMDLRMLVYCAGAERTRTDLERIAGDAGLAVVTADRRETCSIAVLRSA